MAVGRVVKTRLSGFQRPADEGKRRDVGLAVITYGAEGVLVAATCSCGWLGWHRRDKVLEDKIDKHLNKKHDGRGLRL
jgi:hypothetical protein